MSDFNILAKLVEGHGVASGKTEDSRFPHGTIAMQMPYFKQRGLELNSFFKGSLNLDVSPYSFDLLEPDYSFSQIKWSQDFPAENFSFYSCSLVLPERGFESISHAGFIYRPHPSTKPGFHQNPNVLEVIAPFIPNLNYGDFLNLKCSSRIIHFQK